METEEKIVYSIIEVVNKGGINDDALINERLVRSFLATYRGSLIEKYSNQGITVSDEFFQLIPGFELTKDFNQYFSAEIPKFIRLDNLYGASGVRLEKHGEPIPVVNSESFYFSTKNIISQYFPKAKMIAGRLTVYVGLQRIGCGDEYKQHNDFVLSFYKEQVEKGLITVDLFAILENPDDDPNYDWTRTPYPMDSESIAEMKSQILAREYNIVFQAKNDKVTNGDDTAE